MPVHGPLGEITEGYYGVLDDRRVIMEMASASGLPLVPESLRDPRRTSSYGTGEMIADALAGGSREISIAIGGSATNDGGMGCMRALGVRFLDENEQELDGCGQDLIKLRKIDITGLNPLARQASFTVMCDVTNPLCGENGATYTFGKQKGGTPEILSELEAGMQNYRDIILRQFGVNMDEVSGAGAAGGLGAALMVFLNGKLKSGIETVLDLVEFDRKLDGVSTRCRRRNIPVTAIVGSMGKGAEHIYDHGINSIITTVNGIMPLQEALDRADELYLGAARRMFRMLKTGMQL